MLDTLLSALDTERSSSQFCPGEGQHLVEQMNQQGANTSSCGTIRAVTLNTAQKRSKWILKKTFREAEVQALF